MRDKHNHGILLASKVAGAARLSLDLATSGHNRALREDRQLKTRRAMKSCRRAHRRLDDSGRLRGKSRSRDTVDSQPQR